MPIKNARQVHVARDATELDVKRAAFLARRGVVPTVRDGTVDAYVNGNRWVADCPECASGIALIEGAERAGCWECGSEWTLSWPNEKEEAVPLLEARPPQARNWRPPGETVSQLAAENAAMGVS